jgi:hypothetical protein
MKLRPAPVATRPLSKRSRFDGERLQRFLNNGSRPHRAEASRSNATCSEMSRSHEKVGADRLNATSSADRCFRGK